MRACRLVCLLSLSLCLGTLPVVGEDNRPQLPPFPESPAPAPIPHQVVPELHAEGHHPHGTILPAYEFRRRGMMLNDGAVLNAAPPWQGSYLGGAWEGDTHIRYPYYSYRRNWDYHGPVSVNVTIVW